MEDFEARLEGNVDSHMILKVNDKEDVANPLKRSQEIPCVQAASPSILLLILPRRQLDFLYMGVVRNRPLYFEEYWQESRIHKYLNVKRKM